MFLDLNIQTSLDILETRALRGGLHNPDAKLLYRAWKIEKEARRELENEVKRLNEKLGAFGATEGSVPQGDTEGPKQDGIGEGNADGSSPGYGQDIVFGRRGRKASSKGVV